MGHAPAKHPAIEEGSCDRDRGSVAERLHGGGRPAAARAHGARRAAAEDAGSPEDSASPEAEGGQDPQAASRETTKPTAGTGSAGQDGQRDTSQKAAEVLDRSEPSESPSERAGTAEEAPDLPAGRPRAMREPTPVLRRSACRSADILSDQSAINPFGVVRWSLDQGELGHSGIDLDLPAGAEILAVGDGVVVTLSAATDQRPGDLIILLLDSSTGTSEGEGWAFLYEHVLPAEGVQPGARVLGCCVGK